MEGDLRSFRITIVADRYVNPPAGGLDALAVLSATGWGAMQLPAEDYPLEVRAALLAEVAEQAEEFHRHGYDLVLVGSCDGLGEALGAVSMKVPDQVRPREAGELRAFLERRPPPQAGQSPRS